MQITNKTKTIISVILACIIVILSYSFLTKNREECSIIVAAHEIEVGTIIEENDLEVKSVSINFMHQYFPDASVDKNLLIGCVTKTKLLKGQPILYNIESISMGDELTQSLTKDGKINNAFFLSEDERLVAVEVDNSGSIHYSVKKGDFVDVIFSSVDDSTGGLYTNMILQHIEVYDLEKITVEEGGVIAKKQNVVLKATPEQCLKIVAANRNGKIDLALNPLKGYKENVEPVSILSFVAYRPLTKSQKLSSLENYVENIDISEKVKESLLNTIAKERDIDTLIEFVQASNLSEKEKENITSFIEKER